MFSFSYISQQDPEIAKILQEELQRQENQIELIASENFTSPAVMATQGSVLTNKYAEGYPNHRYYGGCDVVDKAENLAKERLKKLFHCRYVNVQPHSGSQANQGIFLALLNPGDTILGMRLDAGGHLSHGAKVNLSGKWFSCIGYGTHPQSHLIDYGQLRDLAKKHRPRLIIAGGSAYPRQIDFQTIRTIADEIDAVLLVDMAHFAGLVATGDYPSPFPHAHIVTSTTHKTLRGPRGGIILTNDKGYARKIDHAIFPGLQGGPFMHVIAAKAVAFGECLQPAFKTYSQHVILNAKAMGDALIQEGVSLVTGGTDTHFILANLTKINISGQAAEKGLEKAGMTINKNAIPFDTQPPMLTSGMRLGSPAGTTRKFGVNEFKQIGHWVGQVCKALDKKDEEIQLKEIHHKVTDLCRRFPLYR